MPRRSDRLKVDLEPTTGLSGNLVIIFFLPSIHILIRIGVGVLEEYDLALNALAGRQTQPRIGQS